MTCNQHIPIHNRLPLEKDRKRVYENLLNRINVVLLMITQSNIQQESPKKTILDLGWSVLSRQPFSSDLETSNFHLFHPPQNAQDQMKTFVENFFYSKPAEFYLRRLTNYLINVEKLFKIIANILLIEVYSLFNHLWMDNILQNGNYLWLKPIYSKLIQ